MSDTIEIVFKGERKELYINPQQFPFKLGDYAIVEADKGEDLGIVNQLGFMLSMRKTEGPLRKILRKPSSKDLPWTTTSRSERMPPVWGCFVSSCWFSSLPSKSPARPSKSGSPPG